MANIGDDKKEIGGINVDDIPELEAVENAENVEGVDPRVVGGFQQVFNNLQELALELKEVKSKASQHVSVMNSKPPKPSNFHGTGNQGIVQRVDLWLFEMEQYCDAVKMPSGVRVDFAASFLRTGAATWWRAHIEGFKKGSYAKCSDWNDFSNSLKKQFKPINFQKIARDKLFNLRQTKSVVQYIYEFHALCLDIDDISEGEKLDKFKRGLKWDVQQEVELKDPKTLEDAMQIAQRIDSIQWTCRQNRERYHNRTKSSYGESRNNPIVINSAEQSGIVSENQSASLNAVQSKTRNSRLQVNERVRCMEKNLCFNCKEPGHRIAECPKMKKGKNFKPRIQGKGHGQ
jgi:hypothetical protein